MALVDGKLLKFLLVGVANTIVGAALMFALYDELGVSYWLASARNYVADGRGVQSNTERRGFLENRMMNKVILGDIL